MLMLVYRISADAFELLEWRSQETDVKLCLLAELIAADFLYLNYDEMLPTRGAYDRLLLTAHPARPGRSGFISAHLGELGHNPVARRDGRWRFASNAPPVRSRRCARTAGAGSWAMVSRPPTRGTPVLTNPAISRWPTGDWQTLDRGDHARTTPTFAP
jgi:hypothetical protein